MLEWRRTGPVQNQVADPGGGCWLCVHPCWLPARSPVALEGWACGTDEALSAVHVPEGGAAGVTRRAMWALGWSPGHSDTWTLGGGRRKESRQRDG